MRYIARIILENFQSYKHEIIDLTPGLNLIIGSSDSGKSAILRAISFVIYNYPRNNTLIHHGETETRVTLEFSDKTKVTRIKGDRNAYIAETSDGKKIELDKIDKTIPEEIKTLLNNPPEDDLNGFISYADQFSRMFLVDLSPTDLPRSLSSLTGIEILEESAKQLMQSYKSIEKQIKSEEKDYIKLLNELGSYNFIDEYNEKLNTISKTLTTVNIFEDELDLLQQYDLKLPDHNYLKNIDDVNKQVNTILSTIKSLQTKSNEYDKLQIFHLIANSSFDDKNIEQLKNLLNVLNIITENIFNTQKMINSYNEIKFIYDQYINIKNNGEKWSEDYKILKLDFEKTDKELEEFKQMLVDKGIKCELCGSILK